MPAADANQLIEQHGLLTRIAQPLRQRLAAIAAVEQFTAGQIIFREGRFCDAVYIVAEGMVALEMSVPRRGPCRLITVGPGDFLGWSPLLGDGRMTATAQVVENARMLRLSACELRELCDADCAVGYAVMREIAAGLSHRLVATRLQLLDLFAETEPAGL